LTGDDRARLRRLARRTWRFFDAFVTEADHGLPPDNFQERPFRGLARRTSPTNIGMGLLSVQAAHDLGYATRTDTVARLGHTFAPPRRRGRHAGHSSSWYSTETTAPLAPRYVSTVDSGNLVAALLTLRQALLEAPTAPWPGPSFFDGLRDTLACLNEALAE